MALEGPFPTAPALPGRETLDLLPEGVLVADAAGNIVVANRRLEEMFAYAAGELVGKSVESLLPARLHDLHAAHRAHFAKSPRRREMGVGFDLVGVRKNGREFQVEVSLGPVAIAGSLYVTAIVADISERKWAEAEIIEVARRAAGRGAGPFVWESPPVRPGGSGPAQRGSAEGD